MWGFCHMTFYNGFKFVKNEYEFRVNRIIRIVLLKYMLIIFVFCKLNNV